MSEELTTEARTAELADPVLALECLKAFRAVMKHDYEDWKKGYIREGPGSSCTLAGPASV